MLTRFAAVGLVCSAILFVSGSDAFAYDDEARKARQAPLIEHWLEGLNLDFDFSTDTALVHE